MSSDTAKENASVVDSSVTDWKHDMGNLDDPESSSFKANEDGYPSRTEEAGDSYHGFGNLIANRPDKLCNSRYFIIKSLNHQNIQLSIERGIWATQVMNEPILEEAFHNSGRVILIFSVNMSGYFQGYAQMMSSVGWRRDNVWSQGTGKNNPWGRSFKVKWLQLNDLPFQQTLHLKNPLNDYKPVKISRDCQELPEDIGEALCELLDGKTDTDGTFERDDLPLKRPCIEPPFSLHEEDYNVPPVHMAWTRRPMVYPSLLYQHHAEASTFHLGHADTFPESLPISSGTSKVRAKHSRICDNLTNLKVDQDTSAFDLWGLSAESPLASTLTEDDFLEMSYEEYLEVHSRCGKKSCLPVGERSHSMQESSRSRKKEDDVNSSYKTDRSHSRKRAHHSSQFPRKCKPPLFLSKP